MNIYWKEIFFHLSAVNERPRFFEFHWKSGRFQRNTKKAKNSLIVKSQMWYGVLAHKRQCRSGTDIYLKWKLVFQRCTRCRSAKFRWILWFFFEVTWTSQPHGICHILSLDYMRNYPGNNNKNNNTQTNCVYCWKKILFYEKLFVFFIVSFLFHINLLLLHRSNYVYIMLFLTKTNVHNPKETTKVCTINIRLNSFYLSVT